MEDFLYAIHENDQPDEYIDSMVRNSSPEFAVSTSFDPGFISGLVSSGFLVMATHYEDQELLLPKLHVSRTILVPREIKSGKTVRRRAKQYTFTFDHCFERVLNACIDSHSPTWITPSLTKAFLDMRTNSLDPLQLSRPVSFELWKGDELHAGEFGILCGGCYTSYSGFNHDSGAGTVQLHALGHLLKKTGVAIWDLGMAVPYKFDLGAETIVRKDFVALFRLLRTKPSPDFFIHPQQQRFRVSRLLEPDKPLLYPLSIY
ncbi:hypothetical protein GW916_13915 [bacterium]|nr:hypothetical protein [bacterium]